MKICWFYIREMQEQVTQMLTFLQTFEHLPGTSLPNIQFFFFILWASEAYKIPLLCSLSCKSSCISLEMLSINIITRFSTFSFWVILNRDFKFHCLITEFIIIYKVTFTLLLTIKITLKLCLCPYRAHGIFIQCN